MGGSKQLRLVVIEIAESLVAGDRSALARLISLVETGQEPGSIAAAELFSKTGKAYVVGITGAPGAGKSTLTDRLITSYRAQGDDVGVLAIDPSSPFTGGAILGDRVRMPSHATDDEVFIRSMATRGHLGGLALATPQAVRILDAAGFARIIIETVGVGQVEVDVARATDTTVVVVNPGWGDQVQANKAGLLEIADVFVVNKADRPGADAAVRNLSVMLELSTNREWAPPIIETVATEGAGIEELRSAISDHQDFMLTAGRGEAKRARRLAEELRAIVAAQLASGAELICRGAEFDSCVAEIVSRKIDPYAAARQLVSNLA